MAFHPANPHGNPNSYLLEALADASVVLRLALCFDGTTP